MVRNTYILNMLPLIWGDTTSPQWCSGLEREFFAYEIYPFDLFLTKYSIDLFLIKVNSTFLSSLFAFEHLTTSMSSQQFQLVTPSLLICNFMTK